MKKLLSVAVLLGCAALSSCDFEKNAVQDITGVLPAARIKFFHFGVNAPGVHFYANDTKMTALLSTTGTESVTGTIYGGVGSGGFYSGIAPGAYAFSGKIAALVDKDLAISKVDATLGDGKFYSFYMSGFYSTTAKTVEGFVVEDAVPAVDLTVAYVRFVNAISNSSPMVLYAKSTVTATETAVGAAVAYKTGGAFTALPGGIYDLSTRLGGSSTNIITRAALSFAPGRVYTIAARGDITIASSGTATNRSFLDNTLNR